MGKSDPDSGSYMTVTASPAAKATAIGNKKHSQKDLNDVALGIYQKHSSESIDGVAPGIYPDRQTSTTDAVLAVYASPWKSDPYAAY
jgi:hypothetical protein